MFRTIGRTWELCGYSWRVLQKDRELALFPIMSLLGIALVLAIFLPIAIATGSLDALDTTTDPVTGETSRNVAVIDVVLLVLLYVALNFVVIFFNASLIAAALERLRGGDPTLGSGIRAVLPHTHNILGWAIIAATVGLLLQLLRERSGLVGRIVISIAGGVWAYITFFVVPVLVVHGVDPFQAITRSGSLFKRTWGEQVTANFGFGLIYVVAAVLVLAFAGVFFVLNPIAGIIVAVVLATIAFGVVSALEGIFKAALFRYASEGDIPPGFENAALESSYAPQ